MPRSPSSEVDRLTRDELLAAIFTRWAVQDPIRFVVASSATTGAYLPSFQLDISGSSGVWAIHGAPDGRLWVGGTHDICVKADDDAGNRSWRSNIQTVTPN